MLPPSPASRRRKTPAGVYVIGINHWGYRICCSLRINMSRISLSNTNATSPMGSKTMDSGNPQAGRRSELAVGQVLAVLLD